MSFVMNRYREKMMYKTLIKRDIRIQMDNVVEELTRKIEEQDRQLANYKEISEERRWIEIVKLRKKQGDVVPDIEWEMATAKSAIHREEKLANIYMEATVKGVAKEDLEEAKDYVGVKACKAARATVKKLVKSVKKQQREQRKSTRAK